MKREFRLTRSTEILRVRRLGKSYAHPLLVLIALPDEQAQTRVGVSASRAVGTAVKRNRAKRLIRAAMQEHLAHITAGWDLILIARGAMSGASFLQVQSAVSQLLRRARLIEADPGDQGNHDHPD